MNNRWKTKLRAKGIKKISDWMYVVNFIATNNYVQQQIKQWFIEIYGGNNK